GSMGGAGIRAAEIVGNAGASTVITGHLGPNAYYALNSIGIKMFTGAIGMTVREAVEAFLTGRLQQATGATVGPHAGMGRGMGGGRGMGRGGGMGGGRGMGGKRSF
ncbi:MAG: NifB/NifX family molybdenum-iron cluster-binding protein, partial [Candidatus Helarchaeales archaeon]